ncbi:MAG: DnaA regulatory inactivator Hda, partial [Burkholderiaceae bacterium]
MKQIALDIGLHTGPTLTNFFAGPNAAALQHLNLWASSP